MTSPELVVSDVRLASPTIHQSGQGIRAWVSLTLNDGLRLDGVALRVTRDGRHTLSFPQRRDRRGQDHPLVRPLNQEARDEIEAQVIAALGLEDTP